jgi:hypothetical protein
MNWDAIGAVGEIVGALAVVISLFYLGMQIRVQNRETRLAAMHEISTAFREAYSVFNDGETADIFVRGNADLECLNATEKVRLFAMVNPLLKVLEEAFWQHKQGRLDEELWYPMTRMFSFFLSAGTFQEVWKQRRHHYNDSFQEFVEALEQTKYEIR